MFGLTKTKENPANLIAVEEKREEKKKDSKYWADVCQRIETLESEDLADVEKLERRIEQIKQEVGSLVNEERLDENSKAKERIQFLEEETILVRGRIREIQAAQGDLKERKRKANIKYHEEFVKEAKLTIQTLGGEVLLEFNQIRADVRGMRIKQRFEALLGKLNEGDQLRSEHNKSIGFLGSGQRVPDRMSRPGRMEPALFWDDI